MNAGGIASTISSPPSRRSSAVRLDPCGEVSRQAARSFRLSGQRWIACWPPRAGSPSKVRTRGVRPPRTFHDAFVLPIPSGRGGADTGTGDSHCGAATDLLPTHRGLLGTTLVDPDHVRRSVRFGSARLFSRWYAELDKHVVVVVVSAAQPRRHWIITAYLARKLAEGEAEWTRS